MININIDSIIVIKKGIKMNGRDLIEKDFEIEMTLSNQISKVDKYIILLNKEYGFSLSKSDLAKLLEKSEQTIDRRIAEACNIPNYIRSGKGKKASYIFPIIEVAEFLARPILNQNEEFININ